MVRPEAASPPQRNQLSIPYCSREFLQTTDGCYLNVPGQKKHYMGDGRRADKGAGQDNNSDHQYTPDQSINWSSSFPMEMPAQAKTGVQVAKKLTLSA